MNLGLACRPYRGLSSLIPGRGCFDDLPGGEIVVSPPSPIVEPLKKQTCRLELDKKVEHLTTDFRFGDSWASFLESLEILPVG